MSESTLSVTRSDLQKEVGFFVGYGQTVGSFSTAQAATVNLCIDSGLRDVYDPEPLPGETASHEWSFLSPIGRVALGPDQADYDLPDDFGGFKNDVYLTANDQQWANIKITNPSRILALRQNIQSGISGPPLYVAEGIQPSDGSRPNRRTLMVYPTPSASYVLEFEYRSNPYQLTDTATYPHGGQPMSQLLIEACIAAAELKVNGEYGVHRVEFLRRLVASVRQDRQMHGTKNYGYNGDRKRYRPLRHASRNIVTYGGVVPG